MTEPNFQQCVGKADASYGFPRTLKAMGEEVEAMKERFTLAVSDLIGRQAITAGQGERIRQHIQPAIEAGQSVCLDFRGIGAIAPPFLFNAFGLFLQNMTRQEFEALVVKENLNDLGQALYGRVMTHAERYFADPDYRESVDEVVAKQVEKD